MALISQIISYHLITWGCQMNVSDSERIAGVLESVGGHAAVDEAAANLIVINTCMVRKKPEEKLFHKLRELAHRRRTADPDLVVVVAGCASQRLQEEIFAGAPNVDIVIGPRAIPELPELLFRVAGGERQVTGDFDRDGTDLKGVPIRRTLPNVAYVTIMMGCNNFCSYCVVPYTRGRETCFPADQVIAEVEELLADGVKEITLLGQNVNSYHWQGTDFPALLHRLDGLPGEFRIKFMTSHPKDMSEGLIAQFATNHRLAPYVHLPVQSGSDRILAAMNRGYTAAHYESLVARLRAINPRIGLTTDFIVGFPGETEADFQETCALVERVGFDASFTFHYSERDGTAACDLPGSIPISERKDRLDRLITLQHQVTRMRNEACIGLKMHALVEGESRRPGEWQTRAGDNRVVILPKTPGIEPGMFLDVEVLDSTGFALRGRRV